MSKAQSTLAKYLPEGSTDLVMELLKSEPVQLKITRPRKTKFGDYRFPTKNEPRHRISVNCNLNPFAFLITLVHEMAHLKAFKNHGRQIKPHGKEWQKEFINLSKAFLEAKIFPEELERNLIKSLGKGAASSCTDLELYRSLKKYDPEQHKKVTVEQLPEGSHFQIEGGRIFKKGLQSRKRFRCLNIRNGREYMVHPLAEVKPIDIEKSLKSA